MAFPTERTAAITGAGSARGIGQATAAMLARQGWQLALLDRDLAGAERLAAQLTSETGVRALPLEVDVTDAAAVDAAFTRIEAELPQLVGLANIAGISSPTPFLEETTAGWNRVITTNLTGVFQVTQRAARTMARNGLGRIVAVSSVSFQLGGGVFSKSAYAASKGGVVGLMRSVARELGAYGITANSVSPGPVDTDIMGGTLSPERKAAMGGSTLTGRITTPDEVAALLAFLMSEAAGNVTGATYDVNGGLHLT